MLRQTDEGRVRTLTMNRPERRNAIDPAFAVALLAALRAAMDDASVGAVVLAGEGPAFCAGLDLKFAATCTFAQMERLVADQQAIGRLIITGPKPVIAAVQGHAVGGGLETALACDLVLWAEGALGWFPEAEKGLAPTGGTTVLLPLIVGLSRAKAMLLLGERWDGPALQAAGLVHGVFPGRDLAAAAARAAARLASFPPGGAAFVKRALLAGAMAGLDEALAEEARAALLPFRPH